jgi:hypothetical protein
MCMFASVAHPGALSIPNTAVLTCSYRSWDDHFPDKFNKFLNSTLNPFTMALVHNAGKLKFGAEKKEKKEKSVFEQLDTLELVANGPRENIYMF